MGTMKVLQPILPGRYIYHDQVAADVEQERQNQIRRWGTQCHDPVYWCGILMEELGELSQVAIEDGDRRDLYTGVTQLAAVAVAMMEDLAQRDLDEAPDG